MRQPMRCTGATRSGVANADAPKALVRELNLPSGKASPSAPDSMNPLSHGAAWEGGVAKAVSSGIVTVGSGRLHGFPRTGGGATTQRCARARRYQFVTFVSFPVTRGFEGDQTPVPLGVSCPSVKVWRTPFPSVPA
ncbi:hypothetical protein GCM10009869_06040 [Amnibacterium kyonggiense]